MNSSLFNTFIMRTSNYLSVVYILAMMLLFSQCEVQRMGCTDPYARNYDVAADIDDGSCLYGVDPISGDCKPDVEGNLVITNQTSEVLYLYKDFALITCIPANAENHIVNIPNQELAVCLLQIWKATSVTDIYDPNISNVYRQWSVALSNTTNAAERANWLITGSDTYAGSGTLNLTYPGLDDYGQQVIYQVDVFLNSKTGAKLASLQPGVSNKKVSVDYGVQYLFFRYWYSDPNSTSGSITELGWNQQPEIVINAGHTEAMIQIPFFYSTVGKYGELTVYNETNKVISIYSNDVLIEQIAKVDGSAQGLSNIPAQNSTTFLIPVNTYSITAKSVDGTESIISFKGVEVIQNETAVKWVGVDHKTVSITNNTTENLLLFSKSEQFLGCILTPGESSGSILVPATFDSLLVISANKTQSKTIAAQTGISVTELDSYAFNQITFTTEWVKIGTNYYRSPVILNNESTTMDAVLINNDDALLSFEYLVSSEADWDYLSFSIDDVVLLPKVSGEVNWTLYTTVVKPGTHTLKWIYKKDELFSVGNDYAEIRNVKAE